MVTLQFCAFKGPIPTAIEWFTQGTVGHVDIVMPDGGLLGAQQMAGLGGKPAGVQIRPQGYGGMLNPVRYSLPATPFQEDDFYGFARAQVGKPYDVEAIVAFVVGRNWRDPSAWFCSELAAAALEHAGIIHTLAAPMNKVTPEGLMLVASALATAAGAPLL